MVELVPSLLNVLVAVFLVLLNGFFVAAEFAFVRIREPTVEELAEKGTFGSNILSEVMEELDGYLATTQLGITVASIGLGWTGEPAIASLLEPAIGSILPGATVHIIAFTIAFSIVTFLHVVIGELAPKTLSIQRTEQVAGFVAPPMKFFRLLFNPGIYVFNGSANYLTSLFGVSPASETDETLDESEIRNAVRESTQQGQISEDEMDMIDRVFEMDDMQVREVMIPEPDVTTLNTSDTLSEASRSILEKNHTRYPILDEEDEVSGFVDVKDMMRATQKQEDAEATSIGSISNEIPVVPETTSVNRALLTFKSEGVQIGAVVDEWGSFEGLITVEDLVEVVVGDLRDKFDTAETNPSIVEITDGSYLSDGGVTLKELSETLDIELGEHEVDTVGGLVMSSIGEIPENGETVTKYGYEFTVESIDGNRIDRISIKNPDDSGENETED